MSPAPGADIEAMKPIALRFRRTSVRTTLTPSALSRLEVRPPSLRHAPQGWWQRLLFWLFAPAPQESSPPLHRLPGVQREFQAAIADIAPAARGSLPMRISHARSLRELWHMRLDVYNLVARNFSEFEAASRLAQLNRHFPTRAPRSGFVPLGER